MGKIRVKTIGIEEDEKDQKQKAKQKAEAKRIEAAKKLGAETKAKEETEEKSSPVIASEAKQSLEKEDSKETKPEVKSVKKTSKYKAKTSKRLQAHSSSYLAMSKMVDKNKKYTLSEALKILNSTKLAQFDQTVELHINTLEKGVSGSLTLPHGTGKKMKVEIADNAADPKHLADLVKEIESGQVNFDILIATPESMSHLARVARVLGPKGLMPNPKNGTVNPKPKEAAKKFEGGQMNFKTEAKAPIMHLTVGKLSFEEKQLIENINAMIAAVQAKNIKNATLKSTMSPGIKIVI
ncbi:MAG TPA: hypothetical protein VLG67_02010 [Candidatus Saccharimonadales bacterium]|nr:hypothetical protein [Candidatus Saccharimonadales bacterium]